LKAGDRSEEGAAVLAGNKSTEAFVGALTDNWAFWKLGLKCSISRTVSSLLAFIVRKLLREMRYSFSFPHERLPLKYPSFTSNSFKCFQSDSLKVELKIHLTSSSELYGSHELSTLIQWSTGGRSQIREDLGQN